MLTKNLPSFARYISIVMAIMTISGCSSYGVAMYGNWCGPGHPKDIYNAPLPIDDFDKACMEHDFCYEKNYFRCECDKILHRKLVENYYEEPTIRKFYTGVYFEINLCKDENSDVQLADIFDETTNFQRVVVVYPNYVNAWFWYLLTLPLAFTVDALL